MDYSVFIRVIASGNTSYSLQDRSPWALGPNPARDQRALVLFVTRTDKNGTRTLQTIVADSADPLVVANWEITYSTDGWIEKILFSIKLWSGAQAYVADDIIYKTSNGKFYICILGHTNQAPPNATYWTEVLVANLYTDQIDNASDQMEVVIMNDLITGIIELRLEAEYERGADGNFPSTEKSKGYNQADEIDSRLQGAYSALDNDRPQEADEQIQAIMQYALNYGTP